MRRKAPWTCFMPANKKPGRDRLSPDGLPPVHPAGGHASERLFLIYLHKNRMHYTNSFLCFQESKSGALAGPVLLFFCPLSLWF